MSFREHMAGACRAASRSAHLLLCDCSGGGCSVQVLSKHLRTALNVFPSEPGAHAWGLIAQKS